jgi:hypothetical protein
MPARKNNPYLPPSASEQVQALQENDQKTRSSIRVALPNGKFMALEDLVDVSARPGDNTQIFSQTEKFLKHPSPGCAYAWVNCKKSDEIMGKVRSKMYRIVTVDEFRDDMDAPISTHKMAGQECVQVKDVVLVEVQPQAVKELYKWREAVAIQKTVRNDAFNFLNNQLRSQTGGRVQAEVEVKEAN